MGKGHWLPIIFLLLRSKCFVLTTNSQQPLAQTDVERSSACGNQDQKIRKISEMLLQTPEELAQSLDTSQRLLRIKRKPIRLLQGDLNPKGDEVDCHAQRGKRAQRGGGPQDGSAEPKQDQGKSPSGNQKGPRRERSPSPSSPGCFGFGPRKGNPKKHK